MRLTRSSSRPTAGPTVLTSAIVCAVALGSLTSCGGTDSEDGKGGDSASEGSDDPRTRAADAIVAATQGMDELSDYTLRGPFVLPDDESNPLRGHDAVATVKVTADGHCETVITFEGVGNAVRRSIDGTTYQQLSDELLDNSPMEPAIERRLRGHWTAQPTSPTATCDVSDLDRSIDLSSVQELGPSEIRGRDVLGFTAPAKSDARVKVKFWVATGADPRIMRISGGFQGVGTSMTLVSENDGFSIEKPPASLVLEQ